MWSSEDDEVLVNNGWAYPCHMQMISSMLLGGRHSAQACLRRYQELMGIVPPQIPRELRAKKSSNQPKKQALHLTEKILDALKWDEVSNRSFKEATSGFLKGDLTGDDFLEKIEAFGLVHLLSDIANSLMEKFPRRKSELLHSIKRKRALVHKQKLESEKTCVAGCSKGIEAKNKDHSCCSSPEILSRDVKPYTFTNSELKSATQDFDPSNKLGEGGFGSVYKGRLNDGREVAVKLLSAESRQGKGQFVAEIVAISSVLHRNLVQLYGCCFEGDSRLLVYEYLPNGSLDQALFGKKKLHLDWPTRYEICLGVARGLVYLHEEASVRVIHRDVKASNILLDSDLVPKISDFALAKLYDDKKIRISCTRVAGTTFGYLAPEYAMRGHLTEKTDVYAFGVVALELVSGRPNYDENLKEGKHLPGWAWNLHEQSRDTELIDDELSEYNMEEVKRIIGIALLCIQSSHALRPPMSRVVAMLSGDVEVNKVTTKPGHLPVCDDTTSSSYSGIEARIERVIRQIRGTKDNVRTKSNEIVEILKDTACPVSIGFGSFAKKMISASQKDPFARSYVIVCVTSQFPKAMDILLAEFHKCCIYTVPKHSELKWDSEAYQRLESIMRLYGALIQTDDIRSANATNYHGIEHGWKWCDRFLNHIPANNRAAAIALNAFLQTAGFGLHQRSKSQFLRVVNLVREHFLAKKDFPEDLRVIIAAYIEKKMYLNEPCGRTMARSVVSAEW